MVVGAIEQQLYVRGLPQGVKMLITDVDFKIPPGEWWPGFRGPQKSIYKNTSDAEKQSSLPMEISSDHRDGYMGIAYLSSQSVLDSGAGPEIYLKFQLSGTSTINGKAIDFSNTKGSITVSSTDWGRWERPDYCNVSYSVQGGQPRNVPSKLAMKVEPKYVGFVVAADPGAETVGMNASQEEDVVKDMAVLALQGVMMAHEKAVGWVVGKLW